MEIVIIALLVVLVALVVFVMVRKQTASAQPDQSQLMIQQQLDSLRGEVAQTLKHTTDVMFESLRTSSDNINSQLGTVRQSLQQTTEQFNQQLSAQTNSIGNRLDNAAKVIQDLQNRTGMTVHNSALE